MWGIIQKIFQLEFYIYGFLILKKKIWELNQYFLINYRCFNPSLAFKRIYEKGVR